jgi:predicted transcriptional regulator
MKVRDLMKKNPVCVTVDCPIQEAAQVMADVECGILPILSDQESNTPIGVLTDRDIVLRCVAATTGDIAGTVGECCTKVAITCDRDHSVEDAFKRMRMEKVGRLLVTDKAGELVGIISMADIIAHNARGILDQLPSARAA